MRSATTLVLVVIALTVLGGCTGWYSRYFERTENSLRCTGKFCFSPRIVSYKDEFGEPATFGDYGYWISIKVYDTSIAEPENIREEDQKATRNRLADVFSNRMTGLIRFDSLKLRLSPQDTSIVVGPDTSRYTPRDINYLSYNFGKVTIPEATESLAAVFYYRILDESSALRSPDTVRFDMVSIEERRAITALQKLGGQSESTRKKSEAETDD